MGGIINNDLIDITLKNTCSFDYFMLCLWVSTKFSDKIIESLNKTIEENKLNTRKLLELTRF